MHHVLILLISLILPPCPVEDSDGCYWDATTAGNGIGRSFVAIGGEVIYLLATHQQ